MIAVIDYGMGNLHSVSKALEAVGADVRVTDQAKDLQDAEKIVLPGVGSFGQGMRHLRSAGMVSALNEEVLNKKKPFLGICLGMQLAARTGDEEGFNEGLGWLEANVVALANPSREIKIPHMGWNDVDFIGESPLFAGLKSPTTFYFVHSYHLVMNDLSGVSGLCEHGMPFVAAFSRDNIHLVQFHPEKSQRKGLTVLENFVNL